MGLPGSAKVPAELSSSMGAGGEAVPFLFQLLGAARMLWLVGLLPFSKPAGWHLQPLTDP